MQKAGISKKLWFGGNMLDMNIQKLDAIALKLTEIYQDKIGSIDIKSMMIPGEGK